MRIKDIKGFEADNTHSSLYQVKQIQVNVIKGKGK
jgi:hypothetical protein